MAATPASQLGTKRERRDLEEALASAIPLALRLPTLPERLACVGQSLLAHLGAAPAVVPAAEEGEDASPTAQMNETEAVDELRRCFHTALARAKLAIQDRSASVLGAVAAADVNGDDGAAPTPAAEADGATPPEQPLMWWVAHALHEMAADGSPGSARANRGAPIGNLNHSPPMRTSGSLVNRAATHDAPNTITPE